ncbi:sugar transferase [Candidatus Omnitrophota bacterium]
MRKLLEELYELAVAWRQYLRHCLHSKRLRRFRIIVRKRLVIGFAVVLLGLLSLFCLKISLAYGQEELAVGGTNHFAAMLRFFPLTVGGGALAMFMHFARKKFDFFKKLFDVIIAGFGLLLLSPVILLVCLLVKVNSRGPVFFRQKRLGKNNRIFKMWKFRTMQHRAERHTGPVWADEDDPRVTTLGNVLRKTHLDELPQLVNVLKGDMSLIGPRPERPEMADMINGHINDFNRRHNIRPGITGLAQVRYRYGASIQDSARKLRYDLLYMKNKGWALDLQILLWTLERVVTREGAR